MDRRSLLDGDGTPTRENQNVFDDEFEVEDFDGIADGFRPSQNHDRDAERRQDLDEVPGLSISEHHAHGAVTSSAPSRNSTRKSRSQVNQANPFASPEDEDQPTLSRTPSGNFTTRRSVSSASSHQYAGTSSPRFGSGSGPSHPYGMYPQMARSPSTATASTARPQRQSSSRYRPQHPYAMYPQGVSDDVDDHDEAQTLVPVGFLGAGHAFQRRRGPDGEEQDILGDYGHAEQLPPYTRYPEGGPGKPLLDVPLPPTALHSRPPVSGSDPGMPLMHTQLQAQPAQQSMTDVSNLQRQPSTMSRASVARSNTASEPQTSLGNKSWSEKSWSEKRKTRFCGIPLLWLILIAGALCFGAALVGGVIGGFVEGRKQSDAKALQAAGTSLYDASLIGSATSTSPPATGTFALSFGPALATQSACLVHSNERTAWDCDLTGDADISIIVDTAPGSDNSGAYIIPKIQNDTLLTYGTQRSNMQTLFSPFLLVKDNNAMESGPAFYFQQQYDKLVVIPESAMDQGSSKIKRDYDIPKGYAQPSAKPWLCFWNKTFVEGFIYPNEKLALPRSTSTTGPAHATTSMTHTSGPTGVAPSSAYSSFAFTSYTITDAKPWETATTVMTMPSTTCTYTGVASDYPQWMHEHYPGYYEYNDKFWPPNHHSRKRGESNDNDGKNAGDDKLPEYPYVVKLEERRIPGSPQPYCKQVQVLNNYHWNWISKKGVDIRINLTESDPGYSEYQDAGLAGRRKLRRRKEVPGECLCSWTSGEL